MIPSRAVTLSSRAAIFKVSAVMSSRHAWTFSSTFEMSVASFDVMVPS